MVSGTRGRAFKSPQARHLINDLAIATARVVVHWLSNATVGASKHPKRLYGLSIRILVTQVFSVFQPPLAHVRHSWQEQESGASRERSAARPPLRWRPRSLAIEVWLPDGCTIAQRWPKSRSGEARLPQMERGAVWGVDDSLGRFLCAT
jgi:hypothetical protein